jgi:hypothetical protein
MKKIPASDDREQRLSDIVRETILDVLRPGEPRVEMIIDEITHRIVDYELKRIIYSALQNDLRALIPELENSIYDRLLSNPEIMEYLSSEISSAMAMVVAEGEPNIGRKMILRRIVNAKELIICDPYYFYYYSIDELKYIEDLISTIPKKYLQTLVIFCKRPKSSTIIRNFKKSLDPKVKLQVYEVNDIHDRVWIKDSSKSYIVGTSFGGIGKKVTFILNLPKKDLQEFLQLLKEIISSKKPVM